MKVELFPFQKKALAGLGYITRDDRKPTPMLEKFISVILHFVDSLKF